MRFYNCCISSNPTLKSRYKAMPFLPIVTRFWFYFPPKRVMKILQDAHFPSPVFGRLIVFLGFHRKKKYWHSQLLTNGVSPRDLCFACNVIYINRDLREQIIFVSPAQQFLHTLQLSVIGKPVDYNTLCSTSLNYGLLWQRERQCKLIVTPVINHLGVFLWS